MRQRLVSSLEEGLRIMSMATFPVRIWPRFGAPGCVASNDEEFHERLLRSLGRSPCGQALIENQCEGGSRMCVCGKTISGNKDACFTCQQKASHAL